MCVRSGICVLGVRYMCVRVRYMCVRGQVYVCYGSGICVRSQVYV